MNKKKDFSWFDYSYFVDDNKLMKRATIQSEEISVKCEQDLEEANGFIVID